jgi:nitroreductase
MSRGEFACYGPAKRDYQKKLFFSFRIFICVKILLLPPDFEIENVPNNARIKTLAGCTTEIHKVPRYRAEKKYKAVIGYRYRHPCQLAVRRMGCDSCAQPGWTEGETCQALEAWGPWSLGGRDR